MTAFTLSNLRTTAYTLVGDDTLDIASAGQLRPTGPAVVWNMATPNATGVRVDNSGIIAPTSGRAFDTSGTATGPVSFSLINRAGANITGASDVMRVQGSLAGGDFSIDNSGMIKATAGRGFNLQNYASADRINILNRNGATIESTDDAIRLTAPVATVFTGYFYLNNNGTIKTIGAGSGQAIDLNDLKLDLTSGNRVDVLNQSTGLIEAADADAIRGGQGTSISNDGTIRSKNATAGSTGNDAIDFQSNSNGSVSNSGIIEGARHGIAGAQPVYVNNQPGGFITGLFGSGVNLDTASTVESRVDNFGTIIGNATGATDGDAVDIDGLARVLNYAGGVIQAFGTSSAGLTEAIAIGGGTISNGVGSQIYSGQRAITVDDSNLGGAFGTLFLSNEGTITGANGEAIVIIGSQQDFISNRGTINGSINTGNAPINPSGGVSDQLVNSGTINGSIITGSGNDLVENRGLVTGTITVDAGDDRIEITNNAQSTTIDGGAGTDTVEIDASLRTTASFRGSLGNGVISDPVSGTVVTFTNIENLEFTGNATGPGGITGGDGDDRFFGLAQNDLFDVGRGSATVDGGGGIDHVTFDFSDKSDNFSFVNGGVAGVEYSASNLGGVGILVTNIESISIIGTSGNSRIGGVVASGFTTTLDGRGGTDIAVVDAGALTSAIISGGLGVGELSTSGGDTRVILTGIEALEFTGNAGFPGVFGGGGDDKFTGLALDDYFYAGRGNNIVDGGAGLFDFAQFDFSDRIGDLVFLRGGVAGLVYSATVDGVAAGSIVDVEVLDIIAGNGDDRIGGAVSDSERWVLDGRDGFDTAVVDASLLTYAAFSGGLNGDEIVADFAGGFFQLLSVEALEFTGNATGTSYGFGVYGGSGNDKLTGLALNDRFTGGEGNDTIDGGGGVNTVSVTGLRADYTLTDLGLGNYTLTDDVAANGDNGTDMLKSVQFIQFDDELLDLTNSQVGGTFTGTTGNDPLTGTGFNDILIGLAGNDTLNAGEGNDTLNGGAGNDILNGGAGIDTARYADTTRGVQVNLALTGIQGTYDGRDTLIDIENLTGSNFADGLRGNGVANMLDGGLGNDNLFGFGGNDTLRGGLGNDILTGGADADTFVFDALTGADTIKDFVSGQDKIMIDQSVFTAFAGDPLGALAPSAFHMGTRATSVDHHLIYNAANGALFYDADGLGGVAQIRITTLTAHPALVAGDFLLGG